MRWWHLSAQLGDKDETREWKEDTDLTDILKQAREEKEDVEIYNWDPEADVLADTFEEAVEKADKMYLQEKAAGRFDDWQPENENN